MFVEGDVAEVDLKAGTVKNTRTGKVLQGSRIPDMLLNIVATGGIIPLLEKEGYIRPSKAELPKALMAEEAGE